MSVVKGKSMSGPVIRLALILALYERRPANIPYGDMFAFTLFRAVAALVS